MSERQRARTPQGCRSRPSPILGDADPRRRRRQPEPRGGQRRAARHRQGVRRLADRARPGGDRLLARPRRLGALARSARRPVRPQDDGAVRHEPVDPGVPPRRVGASLEVLVVARLVGGLSAGMAYPTTLALITALWARAQPHEGDRDVVRDRWWLLGARTAGFGRPPRALLVGLGVPVTLPLAASPWCWRCGSCPPTSTKRPIPSTTSAACCRCLPWSALVLGINFLPVPSARVAALILLGARWSSARCSSAANGAHDPLYDLDVAARRLFWVAALGGIIVFGSLMGAMFIGQQFLQNVLGYDTLEAGAAILPARVHDDPGCAPLGQARAVARLAVHAPAGLRVLLRRVRHDAGAVGRRHQLLGRRRWPTP